MSTPESRTDGLDVESIRADFPILSRTLHDGVPLVYLDQSRSFGGALDAATTRLQYYHDILDQSLARSERDPCRATKSVCGDGAG